MKRQMKATKEAWPRSVQVGGTVVKVYRRQRCDGAFSYEVADYSTGRRKLRSFSDSDKAMSEAIRLARLMASGDSVAARITGREAASFGRAVELLRESGDPVELACARYAAAVKMLGDGGRLEQAVKFFLDRNPENLPRKSVGEVVAELVAIKEARGKSARYVKDLRTRLAKFAAAFHVDMATITTAQIQTWLDNQKAAPQTLANHRRVVGTLFHFAEARGYILKGQNPIDGTEAIRARNGGAVTIYTPNELARLLNAAKPDFVPILALSAFTGIRSAELDRLDWSDVDMAGGFVTVAADRAKTKARRLVPICDALREWLAPYAHKTGPVWPRGEIGLRRDRAACTKTAGVEWKQNALRHSFCSYRLAQVQDAGKVALEAGNSPAIIFAHYRELVRPDAAAAWFNVRPQAPANVVTMPTAANA